MPELTLEQIAAIAAEANSETERALCRYAETKLKIEAEIRNRCDVRLEYDATDGWCADDGVLDMIIERTFDALADSMYEQTKGPADEAR